VIEFGPKPFRSPVALRRTRSGGYCPGFEWVSVAQGRLAGVIEAAARVTRDERHAPALGAGVRAARMVLGADEPTPNARL
jgi:hypothetical protein